MSGMGRRPFSWSNPSLDPRYWPTRSDTEVQNVAKVVAFTDAIKRRISECTFETYQHKTHKVLHKVFVNSLLKGQ